MKQAKVAYNEDLNILTVSSLDGYELINKELIIYCETNTDCIRIITSSEQIYAFSSISSIDRVLPNSFMRIHKSFIVNLSHIKKYIKKEGGCLVLSNSMKIPIARSRKNELLSKLGFPLVHKAAPNSSFQYAASSY